MILTNVITFPGNDKPKDRRATPATVVILPVICIVRFPKERPRRPDTLDRRIMNLRTMLRMDT